MWFMSHPARGAWIEMAALDVGVYVRLVSHPARGAWIEISLPRHSLDSDRVAPRTGCVD